MWLGEYPIHLDNLHVAVFTEGDVVSQRGTLSPDRVKTMSERGRDVKLDGGQHYYAAALSYVLYSAHPLISTLRARACHPSHR